MTWLVIAQVLGGVVLFLLGMHWLSSALRAAAGERLRSLLTAATSSRARGLALGTSVGFLAHSSAATSMTVGFINAGLLSLGAALPVLFGANVGTTLSMQLISFRLTDYALVAVALGGALYLAVPPGRWRRIGQAVLGLGLLFFGMKLAGEAIVPYRATLAPLLESINGGTAVGMLLGVGLAAVVTMIVQSSGAVIGMTFVLAGAGVFTSLWQIYPVVLGAHIGTTMTAVISSLGTIAEARRAALANVLFNLGNAVMGMVLAGVFVPLVQSWSPDLVRQAANTHTFIMVVAAVAALPFSGWIAAGLRRVAWAREPEPASSFLDVRLLRTPEDALHATVREVGRCAALAADSLRRVLELLAPAPAPRARRRIGQNEQAIDEIRTSVRHYLRALARAPLELRQALLAQALHRCVIEVERVGDHVERLAELVTAPTGSAGDGLQDDRRVLVQLAADVVERMAASWRSTDASFDEPSWATLEARNRFQREAGPLKLKVTERLSRHEVPADSALAFSELAAVLDRMVRHAAVIAQEQRQPAFALDPVQLGRPAGPGRAVAIPAPRPENDQES